MSAKSKYPWEAWFAQPRVELTRGVDYNLSQSMMYQSIKNAATKRRKRVHVVDTGEGMVIESIEDIGYESPRTDKTPVTG